MSNSGSAVTLIGIFAGLLLINIARAVSRKHFPFDSYAKYTCLFFLSFTICELISFSVGIWILALVSFWALREYFSLIDIRLQDRLGILGAYMSIPFMFYFILIDWYGMFIISIPVYGFLAIPLLVTLGGKETEGTVFSIGAIDFGLFLFVFCMGHIGYLLFFAPWKAALLIINVAVCDVTTHIVRSRIKSTWPNILFRYLAPLPLTIVITLLLSGWTGIPPTHSLMLGLLIPILVIMGHHTGDYVKADLGVQEDSLFPGRGQILDNLKSLFFTAPVVFHYIRYFLT